MCIIIINMKKFIIFNFHELKIITVRKKNFKYSAIKYSIIITPFNNTYSITIIFFILKSV